MTLLPERASRIVRLTLLYAPTLLALLYYGLIACPRYMSEAQFLVRTASKPAGAAGLGAFLQMTGIARAQDDAFSVQSYIGSRDAIREVSARIPLTEYYRHPSADFVARYPSLIYGPSFEEFHRYFNRMVTTLYSSTTGLTTVRVQAFDAEHARRVVVELLDVGEQVVNRMNMRIQADSVRVAEQEVKISEARLIEVQLALTRFRNNELMIDPARSSVIVSEVIARLSAELVQVQAEITETRAAAPDSPLLAGLRRRASAVENQITVERARISSGGDGLANKLAEYERLVLNREFAKQSLSAASKALETSRIEAQRKQLYLERVVEPAIADYPMYPERLRAIVTAFALNVIGVMIGWFIVSGYREHAAGSH